MRSDTTPRETLGWSIENPGERRRHLILATDGRAFSACGATAGGSVTPTLNTNGHGGTFRVCQRCLNAYRAARRESETEV